MCWGICLAGICPGPGEMSGFQAAAILFVRASVSPTNTFVHYVEIDVVYLSSNIQPSNGQPIYRYDIKIKYIPEIRPSSSGTPPELFWNDNWLNETDRRHRAIGVCSISATRRVFWPKALAAGQRAWPADLPFFDGCIGSIAQFASETSSSEEI